VWVWWCLEDHSGRSTDLHVSYYESNIFGVEPVEMVSDIGLALAEPLTRHLHETVVFVG
jgi:hypothetical protein